MDKNYEIEGVGCSNCNVFCEPTAPIVEGWIKDKCWNCGTPFALKVKLISVRRITDADD